MVTTYVILKKKVETLTRVSVTSEMGYCPCLKEIQV